MSHSSDALKIGYVTKMFPRLSETFILNEILELERRGVEVVIFSAKKPNEGRFHPQLSKLKAPVFYLEDLDTKKWASWIARDWSKLSAHKARLWGLLEETLETGAEVWRTDEVWWAAWMASRARELGIDRLHAHFATLPATLAYLTHRVSNIPFSFTAHAKDIFVYPPEETALRDKIDRCAFMVTVTDFNKRFLTELLPDVDASKIKVVHNGIDLDNFEYDADAPREADLILGVGRLVPKKGFGDLLKACALLRDRGVTFRCVIAGGGVDEELLHEQCTSLDLDQLVTFTGPVHVDHVRGLMQKAAVFCLPCTVAKDNNIDALPTVLLESLACGLPAISTAISGVPEIIESGVDGVLVQPDSPEALAHELEALLASPERRAEFARRGRETALEKFDQKKNVARLEGLHRGDATDSDDADTLAAPDEGVKPRLLYVSTDKGIAFGGAKGASIHVKEFLDAIVGEGFDAVAAVRKRQGLDGSISRYPIYVLPANGTKRDTAAIGEAREFACNDGFEEVLFGLQDGRSFDVVYERYSLFGLAGRRLATRLGVPFILEVNAPLVEEAAAYRGLALPDLAREIECQLFESADHVVAVSSGVRDYVIGVAPQARVTVVPNGVDVDRYRRFDPAAVAQWRARLTPDPTGDFVVGFTGRVRPWHGVDRLIEALARAGKSDPSLRLCVVGDARGMEDTLMELAREIGVADRITFLGHVEHEAMPLVLAAMDGVAAPYPEMDDFYFSPLKMFEYMAAGKPIVASSIGQINDVLRHDETALLVPPGDVDALASAIARLRAEPQLRERLGVAATRDAEDRHTWRHRVGDVIEVVSRLTGKGEVRAV